MIDDVMSVRLSIGDFSRMTHLSVKALRHYHDVGLLEPAEIDRWSGYRYYQPDQVATAQVIRRFRDLGMPVDQVKAVLHAPDLRTRNELITAHLDRMQEQLAETQATVASLRQLLQPEPSPVVVEYRKVEATPALAIAETVQAETALEWWMEAFDQLHRAVAEMGAEQAGPGGALFPAEFYEVEEADLVAYVPLKAPAGRGSGRVQPYEVPAAELAVAVHAGPFSEIDLTYGKLGLHVAEAAIGVEGPIREHYLVTVRDTPDESLHRIEVAWPVFQTVVLG
ncbi:MAG TPA: MerR family transcriptional regulator [Acidimicrobiales bacterium]|nr:MerR family transcriptional regulator [Acidimicrobiales bacterium]